MHIINSFTFFSSRHHIFTKYTYFKKQEQLIIITTQKILIFFKRMSLAVEFALFK